MGAAVRAFVIHWLTPTLESLHGNCSCSFHPFPINSHVTLVGVCCYCFPIWSRSSVHHPYVNHLSPSPCCLLRVIVTLDGCGHESQQGISSAAGDSLCSLETRQRRASSRLSVHDQCIPWPAAKVGSVRLTVLCPCVHSIRWLFASDGQGPSTDLFLNQLRVICARQWRKQSRNGDRYSCVTYPFRPCLVNDTNSDFDQASPLPLSSPLIKRITL